MANITVQLGEHASVFHDMKSGLTITKGQVVELNLQQQMNPKIKAALGGGHLVRVIGLPKEVKEIEKEVKYNPEEDKVKFIDLFNQGLDIKKLANNFNLIQLKGIAELFEIEVEEDDTKASIIEAIVGELAPADE
jgi:hypothetical protein|nr:MAG TPA: hypothetical protein [Caudoviricetes sp.]